MKILSLEQNLSTRTRCRYLGLYVRGFGLHRYIILKIISNHQIIIIQFFIRTKTYYLQNITKNVQKIELKRKQEIKGNHRRRFQHKTKTQRTKQTFVNPRDQFFVSKINNALVDLSLSRTHECIKWRLC